MELSIAMQEMADSKNFQDFWLLHSKQNDWFDAGWTPQIWKYCRENSTERILQTYKTSRDVGYIIDLDNFLSEIVSVFKHD